MLLVLVNLKIKETCHAEDEIYGTSVSKIAQIQRMAQDLVPLTSTTHNANLNSRGKSHSTCLQGKQHAESRLAPPTMQINCTSKATADKSRA